MPDNPDAYKVLQVDPDADPEVIQAAYRRLAQKYHPDLAGDANSPEGREAMARMVAINAAWAVLRDPAKRAEFNRERAARLKAASGGSVAAGSAWDRSEAGSAAGADPRSGGGAVPGQPASRAPSGANQSTWSGRVSSAGRTGAGSGTRPSDSGPAGGGQMGERTTGEAPIDTGAWARAAPAAPGRPTGSVLNFGRYSGWSVGQIAAVDPEYLEWLFRAPIGRPYSDELDRVLRKLGRVAAAEVTDKERRGLFRRK